MANERAKKGLGESADGHAKGRVEASRSSAGPSDVASATQVFAATLTDIEQLLSPAEPNVKAIRPDEVVEEKLPLQGASNLKIHLPNCPTRVTARLQVVSGPLPLLWASTSCKQPDAKDYDAKAKDSKLGYDYFPGESQSAGRDLYLTMEAPLGQCVCRVVVELTPMRQSVKSGQQTMMARIAELKTDMSKREEFEERVQLLEEQRQSRRKQEQSTRRGSQKRRQSQLAAAKPRPPDTGKYESEASLRRALEAGDAVLLRGRWLLDFARTGKALPRRQDLPLDSAWPGATALSGGATLVAVSHCWLTPEHPDPEGHQLRALANVLPLLLAHCGGDAAVFLDWCSLHQRPRDDAEEAAFGRSLQDSELWFARGPHGQRHKLVWKLLLTELPKGMAASGYSERGWPSFERAVSGLLTDAGQVLDLALLAEGEPKEALERCKARRQAPLLPEAFAAMLQGKQFTDAADCELLVERYRETLQEALGGTTSLSFAGLGWGDQEAIAVVDALLTMPSPCAEVLSLAGNRIGSGGVERLVTLLPRLRVAELDLSANAFGDGGMRHIVAALKAWRRLQRLNVRESHVSFATRAHLMKEWICAGKDPKELMT